MRLYSCVWVLFFLLCKVSCMQCLDLEKPVQGAAYAISRRSSSLANSFLNLFGFVKKIVTFTTTFYTFDGNEIKQIIEHNNGVHHADTVYNSKIKYLDSAAPNPQPTTYQVLLADAIVVLQFFDKHKNLIKIIPVPIQKVRPRYTDWEQERNNYDKDMYECVYNKNLLRYAQELDREKSLNELEKYDNVSTDKQLDLRKVHLLPWYKLPSRNLIQSSLIFPLAMPVIGVQVLFRKMTNVQPTYKPFYGLLGSLYKFSPKKDQPAYRDVAKM